MKKVFGIIVLSLTCLFLVACGGNEPTEYKISLTGPSTVEVEDEITLEAKVNDLENPVFVWKSENEKIATVVDGKVMGISVGKVNITVSVKDNEEIEAVTKEIEVTEKAIQYNITVSKDILNLVIGDEETVTATVTPETALSWTSNTLAVATVVDGKIVAVGAGTATISVTTADGLASRAISVIVTAPKNLTPEQAQEKLENKITEYLEATGGNFILYTSDGTEELTFAVQYNISDNIFSGLKYVLSGSSEAHIYLKDGYAYMASNGTTSKTVVNTSENQRLVSQYGFEKVAEQVIAYCQDNALFDAMTFVSETENVNKFEIDVASYADSVMDFGGVEKAELYVTVVDGEVTEVKLVVVSTATFTITGTFGGTGTQSIKYPSDLNTYPEV